MANLINKKKNAIRLFSIIFQPIVCVCGCVCEGAAPSTLSCCSELYSVASSSWICCRCEERKVSASADRQMERQMEGQTDRQREGKGPFHTESVFASVCSAAWRRQAQSAVMTFGASNRREASSGIKSAQMQSRTQIASDRAGVFSPLRAFGSEYVRGKTMSPSSAQQEALALMPLRRRLFPRL